MSGNLLILHPYAPGYYLASGATNPTRYDFPLSTAFGPDGQDEVRESILSGKIHAVCLQPGWHGMLAPERLIAFITQRMRPGEDIGPCRLFTP